MSFEPQDCWDCPVPYPSILFCVVAGLLTLAAGLLLVRARKPSLRIVGGVSLVAAGLWYLGVSHGIWRFGVLWGPRSALHRVPPPLWPTSRLADLALLAVWYVVSVLAIAWSMRRYAVA